MDITLNTNTSSYAASNTTSTAKTNTEALTTKAEEQETAAVYEKTSATKKDSANTIYNREAVIKKLEMDQQSRMDSMQSLVQKLLDKQTNLFSLANSTNLADTFREAAKLASPDVIAQAQKDIAEDGYWGVEQTSDRLVSMAIALSGGDTEKADELTAAITKGFKQATAAWGEKLPQLCQDTYDATMKKMEDWKNGITTAEDYANYLS